MGSKIAKYCAIIGGICLLIAGITGLESMEQTRSFVEDTLGIQNQTLHTAFVILIILASLGGVLVIIGGFLVGGSFVRTGKFLIGIGVGIGLLGLVIMFLINWYHGNPSLGLGSGLGFFGIILSVAAQIIA